MKESTEFDIIVCGMAYSRKTKAILIDYKIKENGRQRCKKLSFKSISNDLDTVDSMMRYLQTKYPKFFTSNDSQEAEKLTDALSFTVEDLLADFQRVRSILENLNEVDLNKVSEEENVLAKRKMDEVFEAKRLKPGDSGFEWDKRVDFSPPEEVCEWDED